MKKLFTIILTFFTFALLTAKGGGGHGGGHSSHSSHSSSHSSHSFGSHSHSGHTTTHHISHGTTHTSKITTRSYTRVSTVHPSEIHTYHVTGSYHPPFIYYYLLFNHNTNCNDTIKSNSVSDLQTQVLEISDIDDSPTNWWVVGLLILGLIVLIGLMFFRNN